MITRSSRSLARRRRSRLLTSNLRCLRLEDRIEPAVIAWDGGAGTFNWADANNWVGDTLPSSIDEAVIGPAYSAITVSSSGTVTIDKFTSAATVSFSGDAFSISSASTTANLSIDGGTLTGPGALTVSGTFGWTSGNMGGTGKTILATTATGTITSSFGHGLGRILENAGSLTFSASNLGFGITGTESGVINNLAGATFTAKRATNGCTCTASPSRKPASDCERIVSDSRKPGINPSKAKGDEERSHATPRVASGW